MKQIFKYSLFAFTMSVLLPISSYAKSPANPAAYCVQKGGKLLRLFVEIETQAGMQTGLRHKFCFFPKQNALFGLKTLGSTRSNFAATLIQKLPPIPGQSPLWKGKYGDPAQNLCVNIGGAVVGAFSVAGGFVPHHNGDQVGMCVFGDGSMVASWTLVYLNNQQMPVLKKMIRSKPFDIDLNTYLLGSDGR